MEKTLFKELVAIYDWGCAIKRGTVEEVIDPTNLQQRLAVMKQLLQRLYIVRGKDSDFGKLFQKFRNTLLWIIHILSDFEQGEPNDDLLAHVLLSLEEFLVLADQWFSDYLQAGDVLSPGQVSTHLHGLGMLPGLEDPLILKSSSDSLILVSTILEKNLHVSPTYSTLFEIERVKTEFISQLNFDCIHPFFSPADSVFIRIGFCDERYLHHLYDKLNDGIKNTARSGLDICMASLKHYMKILEEFSLAAGRGENTTIRFLRSIMEGCLENYVLGVGSYDPGLNMESIKQEQDKITCNLSADQLALLIRAMDDSRLLNAKSMNAVFRRIIPYLSTSCRKHLSYRAVRTKSYSPEEYDREASLRVLEKMMEKIKGY